MSRPPDERRYVRAVEAAWTKWHGKPALISPREFETIDGWRRRGIPLAVVLEVIESERKRRAGRAPRAITALVSPVLEAWGVVAAGRTAMRAPTPSQALQEPPDVWREALARCPETGALRSLLTRLLSEEAGGASHESLDALLDSSLPGAVPDELLIEAKAETTRALGVFRARMSEDEFQRTFARALVDRLRRALALPRLTLTR